MLKNTKAQGSRLHVCSRKHIRGQIIIFSSCWGHILATQALTFIITYLIITDIIDQLKKETETERCIKIFLNMFDQFDEKFWKQC